MQKIGLKRKNARKHAKEGRKAGAWNKNLTDKKYQKNIFQNFVIQKAIKLSKLLTIHCAVKYFLTFSLIRCYIDNRTDLKQRNYLKFSIHFLVPKWLTG